MTSFWCIALLPSTQLIAGVLAAGAATRRTLAVGVASIALLVPLLLPPEPRWLRAGVALLFAMTLFRTIDLVKDRGQRSIAFRVTHVAVPFDTRRIHRCGSAAPLRELVKTALYCVLTLITFATLHVLGRPTLGQPGALLARWVLGTLLAYAATDFAYGTVSAALRAAGLEVYEFHRTPAAALSVKEFWGERWNRTVMAWLREHCVRPLARRGRTGAGLVASFVASALLHAYLVLVSVSAAMALVMLTYFLVQAALVRLETAIGIRDRGRVVRRVWTVSVMLLSSPLFVEPGLRALEL
jgi:hypothetical protein